LNVTDVPYFSKLLEIEKKRRLKIFLVGGTVRDIILKREIKDLDIVVFGEDYEVFAYKFAEEIKGTPIKFKDNVRVVKDGFVVDISKTRGGSLQEDLQKRDFTINNLAMNLQGEMFGDKSDLSKRIIRAISENNIAEDPLRVLRAFRFASELGFEISDDTFNIIKKHKDKLLSVAFERIYAEIKKTVLGEFFIDVFEVMWAEGIWDVLIPELNTLKGKDKGIYHSHDPYEHTFCAAKNTYKYAKEYGFFEEDLFVIFIAAILHDIGKGAPEYANSGGKYIGHEIKGAGISQNILRRLCFSSKEISLIKKVIELHTSVRIYATSNARKRTLLKFIFDYREILDFLFVISLGDNYCKPSALSKVQDMVSKIKELKSKIDFDKSEIITGKDLIEYGFTPSENFGKILRDIRFRLAIGEIKDKSEAVKYITSNYKGAV
jgi:tRNA nucleotidyltransferase/poly(A) polymerase